jgi:uncharacterized membrane protein YczE
MNLKSKRESAILWAKKIFICTISLMLLGIACGINIGAAQGADPITVFYDGLSKILKIDVGLTANILNTVLVVIVFFTNRKYIHIGTVIYTFVLGIFIQFGVYVYNLMHIPQVLIWQVIASLFGCFLAFVSLGGFISIDIGIDPWTAAAIILSKKINKSFRLVKISLDAITLILGWRMGGTVGIITWFCVIVGGPVIQKSAEILDKLFAKMLKSNCENQVKRS